MRSLSVSLTVVAVAFGIGAAAAAPQTENLDGRWSATVVQGGVTIPFRLDISSDGGNFTGTLYNGEEKEITTSASFQWQESLEFWYLFHDKPFLKMYGWRCGMF